MTKNSPLGKCALIFPIILELLVGTNCEGEREFEKGDLLAIARKLTLIWVEITQVLEQDGVDLRLSYFYTIFYTIAYALYPKLARNFWFLKYKLYLIYENSDSRFKEALSRVAGHNHFGTLSFGPFEHADWWHELKWRRTKVVLWGWHPLPQSWDVDSNAKYLWYSVSLTIHNVLLFI